MSSPPLLEPKQPDFIGHISWVFKIWTKGGFKGKLLAIGASVILILAVVLFFFKQGIVNMGVNVFSETVLVTTADGGEVFIPRALNRVARGSEESGGNEASLLENIALLNLQFIRNELNNIYFLESEGVSANAMSELIKSVEKINESEMEFTIGRWNGSDHVPLSAVERIDAEREQARAFRELSNAYIILKPELKHCLAGLNQLRELLAASAEDSRYLGRDYTILASYSDCVNSLISEIDVLPSVVSRQTRGMPIYAKRVNPYALQTALADLAKLMPALDIVINKRLVLVQPTGDQMGPSE